MYESSLFAVIYSTKEVRKQLTDLMELYELEVNTNLKKSEVIKDLQKRLYNEHVGKMKAITTLIRSREYITDKNIIEEIDNVLEPYVKFSKNE